MRADGADAVVEDVVAGFEEVLQASAVELLPLGEPLLYELLHRGHGGSQDFVRRLHAAGFRNELAMPAISRP
ncbi:hypothetical protein D3C87_1703730 [compost metagenome]